MKKSRRDFLQKAGALTTVSMLPVSSWSAPPPPLAKFPANRLSQWAHRGTDFEGEWQASEVEGNWPSKLEGTLWRIGPGTKLNHGVPLQHFFDGDALVTALNFERGKIFVKSRFVNSSERLKEKTHGKMLFHEFGTAAPTWGYGYKNSPNVHLWPWDGKLLALSESSHPTLIDPETLATLGTWDFHGTLPANTTFTAHPKKDPRTGTTYSYGITRALRPMLRVFKTPLGSTTLSQIAEFPLGGFYPIHDFLMTENYLIFVIPPVKVPLLQAATLRWPIGEILKTEDGKSLRILVIKKDGTQDPFEIPSAPGGLIFHHVNAFEAEDKQQLHFHSILQSDTSAYDIFRAWSAPSLPPGPKTWLTRFKIDLKKRTVIARENLTEGNPFDFPCLDPGRISSPLRFVHAVEVAPSTTDPLSFEQLTCWDLAQKTARRVSAGSDRCYGEPVFVSSQGLNTEEDGWILLLGYDLQRDETYLEVRKAVSLELEARAWLGRYLPLGFHGFFQDPHRKENR